MNLGKLANEYLVSRVSDIPKLPNIEKSEDIADQIYKYLTTSKFRRHSMTQGYDLNIKTIISQSISENKAIPLVWVFGCYKLWRLKESPCVDWSELFFIMHKIDWLKPILAIYKPGIEFDFFADGILVPKLNNISEKDIEDYKNSFLVLLEYINARTPKNLNFTLHTLASLYESRQAFDTEFNENYKNVLEKDNITPYILSDEQKLVIQMNVKTDKMLTDQQLHQNQLLFETFVLSSKRRPYYRNTEKIFLDSFPIKNCLPIGSTRSSAVRFWIGKGVLRKYKQSYIEEIVSIKQLDNLKLIKFNTGFNELGKNFETIDVVE